MKVAQRVLEKSGWDMQQIEEETQQMGQRREIEVEEVSALTAFQKDSRIREKLDANNEETGARRIVDETGRELENLPGGEEIRGVSVLSDGTSLRFRV
jgi:hypothetical protein